MKKLMYLIIIPLILFCLVGCDDKPPKEKDLKNWLSRNVHDNYKIISKEDTSNISKENYTIKYVLKSQYGFEFYASVHYGYEEDKSDACGDWSGYKRKYSTNYDDKLLEYLNEEIESVENKYGIYHKAVNYYVIDVEKYKDVNKINNFAYDYYNIFKTKNVNTSRMNIRVGLKFGDDDDLDYIDFDHLLKDKKEHLKELQYYYISKVQNGEFKDPTIPSMSKIVVDEWYIDDTLISDILDKPESFYFLPEYDEYGIRASKSILYDSDSYFKIIIEKVFNGTYEIDDDREIIYTIDGKKYKMIADDNQHFKLNSKKKDFISSPIYYPYEFKNRKNAVISIDDFADIINSTYKIKNGEIYFYSK